MKQVVSKIEVSTRLLDDVVPNKIYAFKKSMDGMTYKLQNVNDAWCFCRLANSKDYWNYGTTFEKAIEQALVQFTVYEFDNLKEFAEWLIKNV